MPRTEAGKRLLEQNLYGRAPGEEDYYYTVDIEPAIDAIEAEAREDEFDKGWSKGKAWGEKQERARIRAAVEGLGDNPPPHAKGREAMWQSALAAVLRIIDGENEKPPITTAQLDWMDQHGRK